MSSDTGTLMRPPFPPPFPQAVKTMARSASEILLIIVRSVAILYCPRHALFVRSPAHNLRRGGTYGDFARRAARVARAGRGDHADRRYGERATSAAHRLRRSGGRSRS